MRPLIAALGYPAAPVVTDTVYNTLGTGVGQGPGSSGFWAGFPPAPNSSSSLYVDLGL